MISEHPDPLHARAAWVDLTGTWQFAYDDADRGRAERWFDGTDAFTREIVVPFPPESEASGIGDTSYHAVLWYRRTFPVTAAAGERVLLHIGAVDFGATVWVDGTHVGDHEGGHSSFVLDITDALVGEEHTLVVRAVDDPHDAGQPRGKQDWRLAPHDIWYHRTSGIWQPVWLEVVPACFVVDASWTPDLDRAEVRGEVEVAGLVDDAWLDVRLALGDEVLAEVSYRVTRSRMTVVVPVPALANGQDRQRLLWSPQRPTLVDLDATLRSAAGSDRLSSYVGLRSVRVSHGRFVLNDSPLFLRLVLEQGYWPTSHLAAPSAEAIEDEVRWVKELGFNGVRIHQKVEDPRFLAACDRQGVLVWGEMAGAYEFSRTAMERTVREWLDVVRRDRGHPSIVAWVPINESWGVPAVATDPAQQAYVTSLYHLTKALDPSRPTMSNEGWEHTTSDVWGLHDYSPTGEGLRARFGSREAIDATLAGYGGAVRAPLVAGTGSGSGIGSGEARPPVLVSEFGGLSYAPQSGEEWFGYATVPDAEALRDRLADLFGALLQSPELAGFCYTQLTDTLQERNGLLTAARVPKIEPGAVRAIIAAPSRAVPTELIDAER